jgi:hypothetical protein
MRIPASAVNTIGSDSVAGSSLFAVHTTCCDATCFTCRYTCPDDEEDGDDGGDDDDDAAAEEEEEEEEEEETPSP